MTVNIPVQLTDEEQAALQREADAQGLSVDGLLRKAALQMVSSTRVVPQQQSLTPEEYQNAWEQIADMIPANIPSIPLETLSRENIYTREDEC